MYLEGEQAKEVLELLKNDSERTYDNYETMLNERFDGSTIDENKKGLARELSKNEFNFKHLYSVVLEN
jgi:thymidylate synthase (FAD)